MYIFLVAILFYPKLCSLLPLSLTCYFLGFLLMLFLIYFYLSFLPQLELKKKTLLSISGALFALMTKITQATLTHLFINRGHPYL